MKSLSPKITVSILNYRNYLQCNHPDVVGVLLFKPDEHRTKSVFEMTLFLKPVLYKGLSWKPDYCLGKL